MAEALRNNEIQAALIIAPLAILLKQQGLDVKIVYIGNRNESTLVNRKDLKAAKLSDLRGKTVAIPMPTVSSAVPDKGRISILLNKKFSIKMF